MLNKGPEERDEGAEDVHHPCAGVCDLMDPLHSHGYLVRYLHLVIRAGQALAGTDYVNSV